MGCYHHLSLEEREDIMCLSREGLGPRAIARELGRDKSTVSRELRRNARRSGLSDSFCRVSAAQRRYEGRRLACRQPRLPADGELRSLVQCKILADRWSPEQVAGRLALEAGASPVSRSTIYRAIARRELGVEFYFCEPHHPWQRGSNENTNGLVREYFPNGTDFPDVTASEVAEVYDALNRRPRKCLGFRTPREVHYSEALHLI